MKRENWKIVIKIALSLLTAIAASLGLMLVLDFLIMGIAQTSMD